MDDSYDVVISGIGGHFPECDNVDTLMEKLHIGENLITVDDRRWTPGKLGVNAHSGKVSEFQYFDNQFYGIHRALATVMDPISRLLLERVAEAVFDAGRSCAYDGTWAWAALGMQMAYAAIKNGECDSVIMGGTSLCLHPEMSVMYDDMNFLSTDGVCRPFDADANGSSRAESQVVFLIQRSDQAKRAYAKVLGAKMMYDGIRERELLSPTARTIASAVDSVYRENKIDKKRVKYVECYGSGYQPSDYAEVEGLKSAFGRDRDSPLLIGSVKGNLGNTEGPSGMVSLVKAMAILRNGVIPKTLNYEKPNPRIPSLVDGSVQVVKENTPIVVDDDTVIGSTSASYSGTVGHVALAVASKNKVPVDPQGQIPRLILVCGRSESEMKRILTKISSVPFDPEYYRLVQDIFSHNINSYNYRGRIICPSPPDAPLTFEMAGRIGRPVWFVFSGMGSQWPGMGRDLLRIPAFAATIDRCHAVLEKKGLDLRKIITHPEPDIFDNILHSFVGIAAVQVGLINIMRLLGIEPDGFIGHSVGEQACAYMDGCISEEQMMLAAYARGMSSNEANLIRGMMAAVGIGYEDIKDQLPPTIEVACHNSSENCTISGPADDVNEYVKTLTERNVFARAVNVSNTAYHSRYVKEAGPILMRRLTEVITEPKERSDRWISTSAPQASWDTDDARFCSATYLTNNLLGAVLFEEAMKFVPRNSILIEIAPHGLLQAILRRSAPQGTTNISLTQRKSADGLEQLYTAIYKMYTEGLCPKVSNLYPDIPFPVSRQTPSTADLVTFSHNEQFYTTVDSVLEKEDYLNAISINAETPSELIRGKAFCTPSFYLGLVWEVLASMRRFGKNEMMIEFKDVRYFEPLAIPTEGENIVSLQVLHASCAFEMTDNDLGFVISGNFTVGLEEDKPQNETKGSTEEGETQNETKGSTEEDGGEKEDTIPKRRMPQNAVKLSADQLYKELATRGHSYQNIEVLESVEISDKLWHAKFKHRGNMYNALAACFQLIQLHNDQATQLSAYPQYLRKMCLDPKKFFEAFPEDAEVYFDVQIGQVYCTGLSITGVEFTPYQAETTESLKLQASSLSFIPYGAKDLKYERDIVSLALQLAEDCRQTTDLVLTILELRNGSGQVNQNILNVLSRESEHLNLEVNHITIPIEKDTAQTTLPTGAKTSSIILTGSSTMCAATSLLDVCPSALVLADICNETNPVKIAHLKVVAEQSSNTGRLQLLCRSVPPSQTQIIMVPHDNVVPDLLGVSTGALLVWTGMPSIGVRAVVDAITKIPRGSMFRMVFILDANAPPFSISHPLFSDQLALGMRINVLQNGVWGSLKMLPLPAEAHCIPNGRNCLQTAVSTNTIDGISIKYWGVEHLSATKMKPELGLDFSGEGPNGKVFGVAKAADGQPRLDPVLRWPVPQGWTLIDAATVPVAYCQAYLALRLYIYRVVYSTKDNILVTDPLRPECQAAVRIALATERVAKVFTIAQNAEEKDTIEALFSDSPDAQKHTCIITKRLCIGNAFCTTDLFGAGIDIVVTSNPENVRSTVLASLKKYGSLVCLGGAETAMKKCFGTRSFLESHSLFFVTIQSVLHMREDNRQSIHQAIADGLQPNGFIKPLRRVVRSNSSTVDSSWNDQDIPRNKVVLRVQQSENPTFNFETGTSCLIVGGTPQQQVNIAHWAAKRGIKTIITLHTDSESRVFRRHAHLLELVYGAKLHIYSTMSRGLQESLRTGSLGLMFAIAQDPESELLAVELAKAPTNAPVIVFGPKGSDHGVLAESCMARHRKALRTFLLVGPMERAVSTRLMDLLLLDETPRVITLLRCPADSQVTRVPAARLMKLLPRGAESLAELGRSFVPENESSVPRLVEFATRGPHHSNAREIFPLFVVPGLAASMDAIVTPLTQKLIVPLICVRMPEKITSVDDMAKEITKIIKERQPDGPYTLLGFEWTATLTQQIAQELEKNDNKVIVFLIDGDSTDVSEIRLLSQRPDFESLLLSTCLNLHVNSALFAEICALPSWSDKIRRLTPLFGEGSTVEVERALNAIQKWVEALARHKVRPCHTFTHLIRSSESADVTYIKTNTVHELRCTESQADLLTTPKLQHYINENMSYPSLQTNEARIKRAK